MIDLLLVIDLVANHCFITEAFIELIDTSKNRPLNHSTDSFKSLDSFSIQCDARNSSCGLNGTVGSHAENITKYRML